MTDRGADAIIARVLRPWLDGERPEKTRPQRNLTVLDRRLAPRSAVEALGAALKEARFGVAINGLLGDHDVRGALLGHRIVVTRDTPGFLADAPAMNYGVIGLDALPTVDTSPVWGRNLAVQMVVDAYREFGLASRLAAWVVMLHPVGKHRFVELE